MKPHEQVQKELRDFPVPYKLVKKKSHLFIQVEGHPIFCISGMGTKTSDRTIKACVCKLRQMRRSATREGGNNV
jgi:hypothetical protein